MRGSFCRPGSPESLAAFPRFLSCFICFADLNSDLGPPLRRFDVAEAASTLRARLANELHNGDGGPPSAGLRASSEELSQSRQFAQVVCPCWYSVIQVIRVTSYTADRQGSQWPSAGGHVSGSAAALRAVSVPPGDHPRHRGGVRVEPGRRSGSVQCPTEADVVKDSWTLVTVENSGYRLDRRRFDHKRDHLP